MLKKLFFITIPALFLHLFLSVVFDRGSRKYAQGRISGSTYIVAAGDTFYSIGQRFGLPYQDILRANNLADNASVGAGYRLVIPGLQPTVPPVTPPPVKPPPVVTPPPVKPPTGLPFLAITSPTPGSTLNPRYTVIITGTGGSLRGGKVLVRVKDTRGPTVISRETTIDNNGRWRVEFTNGLPVHSGSDGIIQAESPGSDLRVTVNVKYR